jgi:hypothetical protein
VSLYGWLLNKKITAEAESRLRELVREVVVLRHLKKGRGGSPEPLAGN